MKRLKLSLIIFIGLIITNYFANGQYQSYLLPISSGEVISFHVDTEAIIRLPFDTSFLNPVHSERMLIDSLCFKYPISSDDGTKHIKNLGQHPAFCQTVVHDRYGNVLIQIVDNNIYNRFGEGFLVSNDQSTLYDENHYWLHQGLINELNGYDTSFSTNYSSSLIGEYLNRDFDNNSNAEKIVLGPDIIVVPVPETCNQFFIIYGTYNLSLDDLLDTAKINVFYRKLTFYNHHSIEMTQPSLLNETSPNERFSSSALALSVTAYRPDMMDYILFINDGDLEVFRITSDGINPSEKKTIKYYDNNQLCSLGGFNFCEMETFFNGSDYLLSLPTRGDKPEYLIIKFPISFDDIQPYTIGSGDQSIYFNNSTYYSNNTWRFEIPSIINSFPSGQEFSPNGNILYVTFKNMSELYFADLSNLVDTIVISSITVPNASYYEFSSIELGRNGGKLYYQGIDITGATFIANMTNPNLPNDENWNIVDYPLYLQNNFITIEAENYHLSRFLFMNQVNGSDYSGIATLYPENACCYVCDQWPQTLIMPAGWSPGIGNNPFNSIDGTVIICENSVIHQDELVQIDNMKFMFEDDIQLKLEAATTGQKGAQLFAKNHAKFTSISNCDYVWSGIYLQGDLNFPQNPIFNTKQPYINIWDNSVIENARQGIYSQHGGIIRAENVTFKNNYQGVFINSFSEPSNYQQNLSQFIRCNFKIDSELNGIGPAPICLRLDRVRGVKIFGSSFVNSRDESIPVNERGTGILGQDAGFTVKEYCSSVQPIGNPCPQADIIPCIFEKWNYGISSSTLNSMIPVSISRAHFKWNFKGSYLRNYNYASLYLNDFEVGYLGNSQISLPPGTEYLDVMYGAYFNECSGYLITENNFHDGFVGLYINNSGFEQNEVYKNYFSRMNNDTKGGGVIALGQNADPSGKIGLVFHCNQFKDNSYHISVIDGTVRSIHSAQKKIGNPPVILEKPADNIFLPDCPGGEREFYVNPPNSWNPIIYYQYPNYSLDGIYQLWHTELCNYSTGFLSTQNDVFNLNGPNDGPWDFRCIKKQFIYEGNKFSDLTYFDTQVDSLKILLTDLVDNGSTLLLTNAVNSVSSETKETVKNQLYETSPYTSDEVFDAVIKENFTFSSFDKAEVLIDNSPLPKGILDQVNNSSISENFKGLINQFQNGVSPRVLLEKEKNEVENQRKEEYDYFIRKFIQNDTLSGNLDTLLLLENISVTLDDKLKWIDFFRSQKEFNIAQNKIASALIEINDLPINLQQDYLNYLNLIEILIEMDTINSDLQRDSLVNLNLTFLEFMANSRNKGYSIAQLLLERKGFGSYPEDVKLQDMENKSVIQTNNSINYKDKPVNIDVTLFPNPATDFLIVNYTIPNFDQKLIEIIDSNGKTLLKKTIIQPVGSAYFQLHTFQNGNYILKIGNDFSQNFMIIR